MWLAQRMGDYFKQIEQKLDPWYRCDECLQELFKSVAVIGCMGKFNPYDELSTKPRSLIVSLAYEHKMYFTRRICGEGIRQYAAFCPICRLFLNEPIQNCLGRTVSVFGTSPYHYYKKSVRNFSKKYQLIKLACIVPP